MKHVTETQLIVVETDVVIEKYVSEERVIWLIKALYLTIKTHHLHLKKYIYKQKQTQ